VRDLDLGHIRTDTENEKRKITSSEIYKTICDYCGIKRMRDGNCEISEIGHNDGTHKENGVYIGTYTRLHKKHDIEDREDKSDQIQKNY
jgi:hypothetical protein